MYWDLPLEDYSFMDYFARRGFRVVALDYRGFGDSDHPEWVTYEGCSRDVEAVVKHIKKKHGISKLYVVGTSLGSAVATYFAGKNQDSIERLVLGGFGAYRTEMTPEREKETQRVKELLSQGVRYVHDKPSLEPGPQEYDSPPEVVKLHHDLIKEKKTSQPLTIRVDDAGRDVIAANIPKIRVPTLVIRGEYDTVPQETALRCFKDLDTYEKAYFETGNAGHSQLRARVHLNFFRAVLGWIS